MFLKALRAPCPPCRIGIVGILYLILVSITWRTRRRSAQILAEVDENLACDSASAWGPLFHSRGLRRQGERGILSHFAPTFIHRSHCLSTKFDQAPSDCQLICMLEQEPELTEPGVPSHVACTDK